MFVCLFVFVKAYIRFTCNAADNTVTVEEDCDTATCDSCKERRERLALPACFTVQHGDETESITVNCTNGTAVVNVYEYLSGAQASCPIGSGAKLAESSDHVSGQCEVDDHGHHEHGDDDHKDDADHQDDHDDGDDKKVKHVIDAMCLRIV